ncbi:retrovirus-related Pol polyprotein from transposon 17.6 [Trichonephila clavipes]|nr:retrovirus-related Pol polyprotein from transposon 17.6 [Trichonephila clavipes]
MNILCLVSPVKVGGKPGFPVTVGGIPFPKTEYLKRKSLIQKEDRTPVSCYGCGAPGIIRSRCHTCNPVRQKDDALSSSLNQSNFYSFSSENISIQGKVIPTELLILKNARGNRTLLGIDFLTAAGIVLDLQRKQWYFTETSHRKYNFVKAPPNINALLTVDPEPHLCQLRKNEGTHLSLPQREEINSLLEKKLNEITVADTYPLPRMDDLLHQAKLTPFMSTLDLRAGYHQVKVHVEDQDKTAFVCPFGTYRFLRMPYGLRNAPATFQRLMNRFCNGLEDILALPYLDDIIVLSETFEKHMFDLKTIFERLLHFKLKANRENAILPLLELNILDFGLHKKKE